MYDNKKYKKFFKPLIVLFVLIFIGVIQLSQIALIKKAYANAPADENFESRSYSANTTNSLVVGTLTFTTDGATNPSWDKLVITNYFVASEGSSQDVTYFTGNVIVNDYWGMFAPTMFQFGSTNQNNKFRMDSVYILATMLTSGRSSVIDIKGYSGGSGGTLKASATGLNLAASGTYGTITYSRTINVSTEKGGLLTFGSDWTRIDTIVINDYAGDGSHNLELALDSLNFSEQYTAPNIIALASQPVGAWNDGYLNATEVGSDKALRLDISPSGAMSGDVVYVYSDDAQTGSKTLDATDISNGYADVTILSATLSGLSSGSHSLTAKLNTSSPSSAVTVNVDKTAPSGYGATIDQSAINNSNKTALSFTFSDAETGATYNYTISSSGGGANVTGSGSISSTPEQVSGIDVSGLGDGTLTLSVTLTDPAGNAGSAATSTKAKDVLTPSVTSVSVPANSTYILGQNLDFTVNFSEAVTVNTTGGTPYIPVTLDTGGTVNASYVSGSGTTTLLFRYTVQSGDGDTNGIAVGGSIIANGGTLRDGAGNNAVLTLNSVGSTATVLVDAVAPTISSVTVPADGTYIAGQNLNFTVNFTEAVTVNTTGGTPYIPITLDTGGTVNASYVSGSGTSGLVFRYTVQSGNADSNGIAVGGSITANGGTLRDGAGNDAALTLNNVGSTAAVLVDAVAPTIVSAARTDNTHVTVTLSENCTNIAKANNGGFTVTETGAPGTTYTVSAIAQGSDASHVVLTVADMGISAKEGVTVKYTAGGNGTVQDTAGNAMATDGIGVGVSTWDTTAPTISSGTLAGNNAYIDVVFSEGIYGAADGITALTAAKLALTFTQNGGSATNAVISSVKQNDSVVEGSASALTGGETTVRVFLSITGTPSGVETIEVKPANGTSVYDRAGNAVSAAQTSGEKT